jgi:2-keto-3-deoxy-L-rhamnonate aldolase RhmA
MSQLQKKISRIQRREGASMGFGAVAREAPRAMLLAALASDQASGKQALEAGADVVLLKANDAASAKPIVEKLNADKATVGVWVSNLEEAAAEALAKAGCDFVVSTLEGTASAAVDTERMGQMVVASESMDDTTLRALGPLGLDGLFVERPAGAMTLAQQLGLVRIASFASATLMVTIEPAATVSDLRVLRDSGTAVVVTPAGTSAAQLKTLIEALKAVPAPHKGKGAEGREMAIVPSLGGHAHEEEDDDDDGDDE